jgi:hypothetical protein
LHSVTELSRKRSAGQYPALPDLVKISFAEVGDFIYYCQIGEQQDRGTHIRLIASQ